MKKLLLLLSVFAFAGVQAQTADEVIDKYFEITGGKENWKSLKTMKIDMTLKSPQGDFKGLMLSKYPNKAKMTMTVMGNEMIPFAYDGEVAWGVNPFRGNKPEKMDSLATLEVEDQSEFQDALLEYASKGHTVEKMANEDIDGTACYQIKLVKYANNPEKKKEEYYFFDIESGILLMSRAFVLSGPAKGKSTETHYSDYQEVNGLYIAHSIISKMDDNEVSNIVIDKIETGVDIADSEFTIPAE